MLTIASVLELWTQSPFACHGERLAALSSQLDLASLVVQHHTTHWTA